MSALTWIPHHCWLTTGPKMIRPAGPAESKPFVLVLPWKKTFHLNACIMKWLFSLVTLWQLTLANDFIFRFVQRWRGLICPDCFTLSLSRWFNERLVVFRILCEQKKNKKRSSPMVLQKRKGIQWQPEAFALTLFQPRAAPLIGFDLWSLRCPLVGASFSSVLDDRSS